jgi:hypothetical protein
MTARLCSLLLAALLVLPASAQTAVDALRYADRNPALGLRAAGRGGTAFAGWADPAALVTNPAGLGFYTTSTLGAALAHAGTQSAATYRIGTLASEQTADARALRLDGLSFVGKAQTVRGSLVFGAAFQQTTAFDRARALGAETNRTSVTFGLVDRALADYQVNSGNISFGDNLARIGYEAGLIDYVPSDSSNTFSYPFYTAVLPNTTVQQLARLDEEGALNELTFGGAVESAPGLMIGASVGLAFGRYRFTQRFEERDVNDENRASDFSLTIGGVNYAGFEQTIVRDRFEDRLVGVNARFGLAYQAPGSGIRVGASLETPTYYTVQEDYSTQIETRFDNGRVLSYGGRSGDTGTGDFEFTLRTPWRLGAGARAAFGTLTLSADAEYVDWTAMRFDAATDPGYFDGANDDLDEGLEPTLSPRVGAELSIGVLALRAGYAFQPDPRREKTFLGQASDRSRTLLTGGLSYRLSPRAALDVALGYTTFGDEYQPYVDDVERPFLRDEAERLRVAVGLRVGI